MVRRGKSQELHVQIQSIEEGRAAAFALVAGADGKLAYQEQERFRTMVQEQGLQSAEASRLESAFRHFTQILSLHPAEGREQILKGLRLWREQGGASETIIQAAQIALISDGHLHPAEEYALHQLCDARGLDPREPQDDRVLVNLSISGAHYFLHATGQTMIVESSLENKWGSTV